jgi:hypothetical protein
MMLRTLVISAASFSIVTVIASSATANPGNFTAPCSSRFCVTGDVRVTNNGSSNINGNSSPQVESGVGIIFNSNPPDVLRAESERFTAETNYLLNLVTLQEKLAFAIANNHTESANAIAIVLAPKLGYTDFHKLIEDIRNRSSTK